MATKDNVLPFDRVSGSAQTAAQVPEFAPLLEQLHRVTQRQTKGLLDEMFDNVDDFLFDLADKAPSNQQQSDYFDAMRSVRLRREAVTGAFLRTLHSGDYQGSSPVSAAAGLSGLSLVDEDELEESLAITNMSSKAESLFHEELYGLEERLAVILGEDAVNPFAPKAVCEAFRASLGSLDTTLEVKLIVYKLFDRFVIEGLGPLYQGLNANLVNAGVLPQIKTRVRRDTAAKGSGRDRSDRRRNRPDAGSHGEDSATSADREFDSPSQDNDVLRALSALLAQRQDFAGDGAAGLGSDSGGQSSKTGTGHYSPGLLIDALSQLQRNPVSGTSVKGSVVPLDGQTLKQDLLNSIGAEQESLGRGLRRADADLIDIVGMMFDFILDDHGLPAPIKALIARLQIPVLKVAVLDQSFFARKDHPARQLLNELARAGTAWNGSGDDQDGALFRHEEKAVNRIIREFNDDVTLFDDVLAEFRSFLQAEQAAVEARRVRLTSAKAEVATALEPLLQQDALPRVVERILRGPWLDLLTRMRLGKHDPAQWQAALATANDLVWSVYPKASSAERSELARTIPRMLRRLSAGMDHLKFPEQEKQSLFKELEYIHLQCLRPRIEPSPRTATFDSQSEHDGDGRAPEQAPASDATHSATPAAAHVKDALMEEIILASEAEDGPRDWSPQDPHIQQARALSLGTWLILEDEAQGERRAKLAWKSDLMGQYTFVDRRFRVVLDTTLGELAALFRDGHAKPLQDVPLIDRALDAMLNALKPG